MAATEIIQEIQAQEASKRLGSLRNELRKAIYGQDQVIDLLIIGLIARGHILLEGLPGLGKTQLIKTLGEALNLQFRRVQFTPDLLPGDITGNPILEEDQGRKRFVFREGPIFTNLLLADEINRASPKTQSALLEAMQEAQVTSLGETHQLPQPFFVLATQNPIELEGTYSLPEAQLDRFLFKVEVKRPSPEVLEKIVGAKQMGDEIKVQTVMNKQDLIDLMSLARKVFLPEVVGNYIARLVDATHGSEDDRQLVKWGASPRAALALSAASRARALIQGRINVGFEDVQAIAIPALHHRIVLDYSAKLKGKTSPNFVANLMEKIPVSGYQKSALQQ